jgi:6-phosphogluconolactonase
LAALNNFKRKTEERMKSKYVLTLFVMIATLLIGFSLAAGAGPGAVGAVYSMTNADDGNEVVVYNRAANGALTLVGPVPTGGNGFGAGIDPLGSQGSLTLSPDGRWLLAVNAGSNDVSVFQVSPQGIELVDVVSSGGNFPVSLTIFHNLVYVLNAGPSPNISGFILSHTGGLVPLADSARSLGSGMFAQVGFDPRGKVLVVTDREEHEILVYSVGKDGLPSDVPVTSPSNGLGPFGFIFDNRGNLLVSEAGSGAVSSYEIMPDGTLQVITASELNGQIATCWIAGKTRYAFTANTGSSSISSYAVEAASGAVSLIQAVAWQEDGTLPIDSAISVGGRFLYTLNAGSGGIGIFQIKPNGTLVPLGEIGGLSIFAQGIAVR